MAKGKRESIEDQLADMDIEARTAFDEGKKEKAANVRDRMAVVAKRNEMPKEVVLNKLSAESIRAGYDTSKAYLEPQGWQRSIGDYVAAEIKGQESSLRRYFPTAVFLIFVGLGVSIFGVNITGNVVGESSFSGSSLIGIMFLLIGILGLFLKLRN